MSFEKVFKTAANSIKTSINQSISNGMDFNVQVVPLGNSEGEFPHSGEVFEFVEAYVKKTMQYKALNPRALEGMRKKWEKTHGPEVPFVPKRQPSEIVVVLIAPSDTGIHLFHSVPKTIAFQLDHHDDHWEQDNRDIFYTEVQPPTHTTLFKYRDQLSQEILAEIKKQGLYPPDEDSDEEFVYDF